MESRPWGFAPWQKVVVAACVGVLLFGGAVTCYDSGRRAVREPAATAVLPSADEPPKFLRIHVTGAVRKPGVYTLGPDDRVIDAIEQAGGAASGARLDELNLAAPLRDGIRLYIPGPRDKPADQILVVTEDIYLKPPPATPAPTGERPPAEPRESFLGNVGERQESAAEKPPAPAVVNLNTATLADLETLPGIGEALAQRIVAFRETRGPFRSPADIQQVRGIGEKTYQRLKPYLTVD